jgi:hypothetical protein
LTYTPLLAHFTVLWNFTYWTEFELYGFLCTSHRRFAERQPFLILPNILVVAGAFCVLLSLSAGDPGFRMIMFLGGGLMLSLGIVAKKLTSETIKVVQRNKKYIWIKGINQNLLAQLEDFSQAKS